MRKLFLFLIIPVLLSASACKKFLDVNKSPNNPEKVPPSVLLPETTIGIAFANTNDLDRATSVIVQHIAGTGTQSVDYDTYKLEGYFDNQWNLELYNGVINNLVKLIQENQETNPQYAGIAKLEMAYAFSMITDLWGDVPYSQAGFGLQYLNPRFDKQQDIYLGNSAEGIKSLFDLVTEGMADLDKPSILKPLTDDIVYGGKIDKWKRMGNTLLLKFANTISFKNPALAKTIINNVITGNNYINANSLDFQVPFGGTGNQNPLYSFNWVNRKTDQMLSTRFLNLELKLNDTLRLAKFFTQVNGQFVSYDNGNTVSSPGENARSKYNTFLTGAAGEAPAYLMTYSQVNFILAESALMLGTAGNANTYFQAGIRANMQKVGLTSAEIDTFYVHNPTVVNLMGTQEEQLEQIITQKYISWVGNGIEAFNDFRRTGYPKLALARNAAGHDPNTIPTRLTYPNGELQRNPNCPNPITRTNVKVWWAR